MHDQQPRPPDRMRPSSRQRRRPRPPPLPVILPPVLLTPFVPMTLDSFSLVLTAVVSISIVLKALVPISLVLTTLVSVFASI